MMYRRFHRTLSARWIRPSDCVAVPFLSSQPASSEGEMRSSSNSE